MSAVVSHVLPSEQKSVLVRMANRFGVDADKMMTTLKATAFRGNVSNEQMMALLVVADQHGLNPWLKEIYAFPDRNNGIVPVVGVDGWSRIINSHPQFDGIEFAEGETGENDIPKWIECAIFRKDRSHPVKVKEYFSEVYRDVAGPWKSHPRRMLRHKAMIQAARLAFSFAGIYDPDEAERVVESGEQQLMPIVDLGPRPDTSEVDSSQVMRWIGDITDILNQDKEEAEIAAQLREVNMQLSQFPDLFTVVLDRLAKDGIITKANYRKYLAIGVERK